MTNVIKIKRGQSTNIDATILEEGELAVTLDTGELYVGDGSDKIRLNTDNSSVIFEELYPVGSIYITSTNQAPELSGAWELFDKEFSSTSSINGGFNVSSSATDNGCSYSRAGHSINIVLNLSGNTDIDDVAVVLGNFDFNELGITRFNHTFRPLAHTDSGNAAVGLYINYSSGELQTLDIYGEESIAAGSTFYTLISIIVSKDYMLDEACDKFYWKRIS